MKNKLISLTLLLFIGVGCAPRISYLGDTYSPTRDIDVFYDEKDIEKEYTVIGIVRNEGDGLENNDLQAIKDGMVKKAMEVGAHGLLIVSIGGNANNGFSSDNQKVVEGKLFRYK